MFLVILLYLEYFENSKKFLIIDIITKLSSVEGLEIKNYQINFVI